MLTQVTFNSPFTPAGASPAHPTPRVGDQVEVTMLPLDADPKLKMWSRGTVARVRNSMFYVQFAWGVAQLNVTQVRRI